jgi:hypothetical protein
VNGLADALMDRAGSHKGPAGVRREARAYRVGISEA